MTAINGSPTYYRTAEACKLAGISRSTLLRWFKNGTLKDMTRRDRRGWRLFTQADVEKIRSEAEKASETSVPS
jgi:excisionase family DNA binding protein